MSGLREDRIDDWMRMRLLVGKLEGETPSPLAKVFEGLISDRAERLALVAAGRERLIAAGDLEDVRRCKLSAAGRASALGALGLRSVGAVSPAKLVRGAILAHALGLPPLDATADRERFGTAGGLRAAVVRLAHDLDLRPYPSASEVQSALVGRAMERLFGVRLREGQAAPKLAGSALAMLYARELGQGMAIEKPATGLPRLAARALGAARTELGALQSAALHRWLRGETVVRKAEAPASASVQAAEATTGFVDQLREAARGVREGRFGPDRVWLAALYREYCRRNGARALVRPAFEAALLDARRRDEVKLSRADYMPAMDPEMVRASRLLDRGVELHFYVDAEGWNP